MAIHNQVLASVVEEHAEEAAILWIQRDRAVRSQDYDLDDLAELDERIEAHLDGLRVARDAGWESCKEIGWKGPGEFFVAMSLAINAGSADRVMEVLSAADTDIGISRGIVSALGWAPASRLQGLVKLLLEHGSSHIRVIALSACAAHRVNPNSYLSQSLQDDDERLRARALRCVGELGLSDYLPELRKQTNSESDLCRFWSAWSAVLLGDTGVLPVLKSFVNFRTRFREPALQLAIRVVEPESSINWIRGMAGDRELLEDAILASGHVGDPAFVPSIIRQMQSDEYACAAGQAFSVITGADIGLENLGRDAESTNQIDDAEYDQTGDPDLEPGIEEELLLPDAAKVAAWWERHRNAFIAGQRYLVGKPLTPEQCQLVLRTGYQPQRYAAALELALANHGSTLFETRAPGYRQKHLLGV